MNRIPSCRGIETELTRNLELMWLAENQRPEYWTINTFRKENKKSISKLTKAFRRFILAEGFASVQEVYFDGCKIKACANPDSVLAMKSALKTIEISSITVRRINIL